MATPRKPTLKAKKPVKSAADTKYRPGHHPNSQRNLNREGRAKGAAKPGEQRALTRGVYANPETVVTPNGIVFGQTRELLEAMLKDGSVTETRFQALAMRWIEAHHRWQNMAELDRAGRLTAREQVRFDRLEGRLLRMEREMGLTPASAVDVGLKAAELAAERQKQLRVRPILTNEGKLRLLYQLARGQLLPGLYLLRDEDLDGGDPTFAIPRIMQLIRAGRVPGAFLADVPPDARALTEEAG
jgi:hypothetical protein